MLTKKAKKNKKRYHRHKQKTFFQIYTKYRVPFCIQSDLCQCCQSHILIYAKKSPWIIVYIFHNFQFSFSLISVVITKLYTFCTYLHVRILYTINFLQSHQYHHNKTICFLHVFTCKKFVCNYFLTVSSVSSYQKYMFFARIYMQENCMQLLSFSLISPVFAKMYILSTSIT
jgi:hypothetical protein